jgi:hypothetical protein
MARREQIDACWWKAENHEVAAALWSYRDRLEERSRDLRTQQLRHARLYGGMQILGLKPGSYTSLASPDRIRLNVIASCVDTAAAKISQSRPSPQFLTNGADYKTRRKAEKLNKFGKGLLYGTGFYRLAPAIFKDGAVFGTGLGKLYTQGKRIHAERTFPWEVLVDQNEGYYSAATPTGMPRTIVQRKFVERSKLLEAYGGARASSAISQAIAAAPRASEEELGRDPLVDQIEVVEGWRSQCGEEKGRHAIAIQGRALRVEPWERERLPFVVFRWSDPLAGFWGQGIPEELTSIQFEINVLLEKIQNAFHLLGIPRVYIDSGSGVPKSHMTNEMGAIITLRPGTRPPVVDSPRTINPEVFEHLNWLYQRAYEITGVSQMSATSQKPAGLDSGVALREYNDIQSDRFVLTQRRYEDVHLDATRVGLDEAREIPGFTVDVPDRHANEKIGWKDVRLDESDYFLQCFPSSLLPQTPAGRLARVQELMAAGLVPQDAALELLDAPDMEEFGNTQTAPRRAIRQRIGSMLDGGEYVAPEPFDDLTTAISMTRATYLLERENGAPEEVLENLRNFINDCTAMLSPPQQAPGVAPGAPAAMPVAAPPVGPSAGVAPPMAGAPMMPGPMPVAA